MKYENYDDFQNPYYEINKRLGFPFFREGYQLSPNNVGKFEGIGSASIPVSVEKNYQYNSEGFVSGINQTIKFNEYVCF